MSHTLYVSLDQERKKERKKERKRERAKKKSVKEGDRKKKREEKEKYEKNECGGKRRMGRKTVRHIHKHIDREERKRKLIRIPFENEIFPLIINNSIVSEV